MQEIQPQLVQVREIVEQDAKNRTKFEGMVQKFQQVETKMALINEDINSRAPRIDLKALQECFRNL